MCNPYNEQNIHNTGEDIWCRLNTDLEGDVLAKAILGYWNVKLHIMHFGQQLLVASVQSPPLPVTALRVFVLGDGRRGTTDHVHVPDYKCIVPQSQECTLNRQYCGSLLPKHKFECCFGVHN